MTLDALLGIARLLLKLDESTPAIDRHQILAILPLLMYHPNSSQRVRRTVANLLAQLSQDLPAEILKICNPMKI
jgi:hypothetical protein